jgi:hypothetical protein
LVSSVGGIKKFSLRILPKKVAAFIEEEEEKMGVLAVA